MTTVLLAEIGKKITEYRDKHGYDFCVEKHGKICFFVSLEAAMQYYNKEE